MRYRGMAGLLAAVVLAACSPATPPVPTAAEDPAYAAAQQWRVARYQDPARWLDGAGGLHWLQNKSHFVGSGATNGIRRRLARTSWACCVAKGRSGGSRLKPVSMSVMMAAGARPHPR